ncbi:TetR/AcrR family transcriptional regulator [Amycolatopsis azurea]|uniref:TetR family transcriptional regulator n=1 Tax=Amycolatopsis azurea DSM 43854 TaxID=1238180 RepID=M2Q356_9PSEU|nr:TetR/AcrR family transcriptional regulator [Amycolatopsis azurea]EMD26375.1 Transcriptional regulator, TetR family [Amycolatopsis azurea DSM 43854]OOC02391.1 TetR family transcriptional regulator [Amycolatopsis azurea DSM 43854]
MAGSPAAERGQVARRRLLEAAVALVPELGWSAVSTRILAERAGVTPSVVHYHFPSLQALMIEAVLGAMREVAGAFEPALETVETPAEAVDALLASVGEYSGTDPMSLLFAEAYLAATRDDTLRQGIRELLADLRARFGAWLSRRGVADAEGTAAVLFATVDGLLLHRALEPESGREVPSAVLRRLVG